MAYCMLEVLKHSDDFVKTSRSKIKVTLMSLVDANSI